MFPLYCLSSRTSETRRMESAQAAIDLAKVRYREVLQREGQKS